jgi:hypothetical protein
VPVIQGTRPTEPAYRPQRNSGAGKGDVIMHSLADFFSSGIFGNMYVLAGIVVVILLLVLMLVLLVRGRRTRKGARQQKPRGGAIETGDVIAEATGDEATPLTEEPAFAAAEPSPLSARSSIAEAEAAVSRETEAQFVSAPVFARAAFEDTAAEMPVRGGSGEGPADIPGISLARDGEPTGEAVAEPASPVEPVVAFDLPRPVESLVESVHEPSVTSLTGLRSNAAPVTDPLKEVILDLVQGWGDLGPEDLKRLEIFRPEKVLELAEAMQLPKNVKGNEYSGTRLRQIRQYAATAKTEQKPTQASSGGSPEATLTTAAGVAASAGALSTPAASGAAAAGEAAAAAARAVPGSSWPATAPPAQPTEASSPAWPGATRADAKPLASEVIPSPPAPESDRASASGVAQSSATSDMGRPGFAGFAAKPADEILAAKPAGTIFAPVTTPPESRAAEATELAPATVPAIQHRSEAKDRTRPLQATALAFLQPAELSRVFGESHDTTLKKTIIDNLEHLGSPSALDVLRTCLDDPDPEVQMHALEAADRMLAR